MPLSGLSYPNCSDEDSEPDNGEGILKDNFTRIQLNAEAEAVTSKVGEEKIPMSKEPETHDKAKLLNIRLGFVINCDPYQGGSEYYNSELGLGGSVVYKPVQCLPE